MQDLCVGADLAIVFMRCGDLVNSMSQTPQNYWMDGVLQKISGVQVSLGLRVCEGSKFEGLFYVVCLVGSDFGYCIHVERRSCQQYAVNSADLWDGGMGSGIWCAY